MEPDKHPPLRIPYLHKEVLRTSAKEFLVRVHPDDTIPVPVELIVERQGIDIVPLPGLKANFETDGFTAGDLTIIRVDQWVYESYENRYRFTLAHEMGHIVLHKSIFDACESGIDTVSDWIEFTQSMSDSDYSKLEFQANCFAGLVLVPDHHLRCEFENARQKIREQIRTAVAQGLDRSSVVDVAWESLVMRLAQPFRVSKGVIERRLKFEGITSADL